MKSYEGFKEAVSLWKQEKFRKYISEEKKKYDLKIIDIEIQKLVEIRSNIKNEEFLYEDGKTIRKLKNILPWTNITEFVKEYKKHNPSKKKKSSSIIRFITEFASS